MEVAQLSELYREAVAVRDDAVRASLANSVAQAAAAAAALQAAFWRLGSLSTDFIT